MARCPMCKGMRMVVAAGRMRRPCPTCGGTGEVRAGTCSTCRHKGGTIDQLVNVSLLALDELYCKLLGKTVKPGGCSSYEAR